MKFLQLLALLLVFSNVFSILRYHSHQELKSSLRNLKDSSFGSELFTAIALELETTTNYNDTLNTVLDMLYGMRDSLFGYWQTDGADVAAKSVLFKSQQEELQNSIEKLNIKLVDAEDILWDLEDQVDDKELEKLIADAEVLAAQNKQYNIQTQNLKAIQEFNESQAEHDDMIEVFKQCKILVSQLASSFIQKGDTKVLEKNLKNVAAAASKLTSFKNILLATNMIEMSSNQEVQSDPSKVSDLIEILDSLIAAEEDCKKTEYWVEQKRLDLVELKMESAQNLIDGLDAVMLEINADLKGLHVKIQELKNDCDNWELQLEQKSSYLEDISVAHAEEIAALQNSVTELASQIEILNKVIEILESEPLEDIDSVVQEVNAL